MKPKNFISTSAVSSHLDHVGLTARWKQEQMQN